MLDLKHPRCSSDPIWLQWWRRIPILLPDGNKGKNTKIQIEQSSGGCCYSQINQEKHLIDRSHVQGLILIRGDVHHRSKPQTWNVEKNQTTPIRRINPSKFSIKTVIKIDSRIWPSGDQWKIHWIRHRPSIIYTWTKIIALFPINFQMSKRRW